MIKMFYGMHRRIQDVFNPKICCVCNNEAHYPLQCMKCSKILCVKDECSKKHKEYCNMKFEG